MMQANDTMLIATESRRLADELDIPRGDGAAASDGADVKKVIVAVHGIGDQVRYATIRSVIAQFRARHGLPSGVPLGSFYDESKNPEERKPLKLRPPYSVEPFGELAFTEVYWAGIPREIVYDLPALWRYSDGPHPAFDRNLVLALDRPTRLRHLRSDFFVDDEWRPSDE